MKFRNNHKNVELVISKKLLDNLKNYGIKHYPNEFGGFLIGYYSNDLKQLYISGFILPKNYNGVPYLFERSTDGLEKTFENIFNQKNQFYVGEWHTHPNGSSMYSQTDLNTMIEISNHHTVNIENPILLIMGISQNKLIDFSIYLYDKKGLHKYE